MMNTPRVAWVFPSLQGGNYWHPVISEFTKFFQKTIVYTGYWTGFSPGFEDSFRVQTVGKTTFLETKTTYGYSHGISFVSPDIIRQLHQAKPDVVFTLGFSLWTLLVVLLKPLYRWRVVIVYDGSSPNVDYLNSPLRLWIRGRIVDLADACITNSQAGKNYLVEILGTPQTHVFQHPYEVPDTNALSNLIANAKSLPNEPKRPLFLFVGQLIPRKGLELLLRACQILQSWGYRDYTLQVLGQGEQREELEAFSKEHHLSVDWVGWIDYGQIGTYFRNADVFVLPSLEDTWGMVVLEAMVFGKPVICSKAAGASEMIVHGENGYLWDSQNPEDLANWLRQFIDHADLIATMGEKSRQLIAPHTPESAAKFLQGVVDFVTRQH